MKTVFDNISDLPNLENSIDITKYDSAFLNKSIQKRVSETLCNSSEEYYTYMAGNSAEAETFLNSLQISYSEFFRNPLTFAVLEQVILPTLVKKKKNSIRKAIRIWSAACAAGQEAYSIAMILEEVKIGNSEVENYHIFATDQSELQISKAKKGIYPEYELGRLNMKRTKQWFNKNSSGDNQDYNTYSVNPALKQNIDFSVFDLFNKQLGSPPSSIFGDFDIVICANLLFYFNVEYQKIIIKKIEKSIAKEGYIIVGEAERDIMINYNFREVFPGSGIFQSGIKQYGF